MTRCGRLSRGDAGRGLTCSAGCAGARASQSAASPGGGQRAAASAERFGKIFLALLLLAFAGETRALTLEQALAQTLARNPQIAQAKASLEQAAGARLVFRSIARPRAGLAVIAGAQGGDRAGADANEPFAFTQAEVRQPLFQAAIPPSWRRGDLGVLVAAQELNVAAVEQLHLARTAFYTALFERALEELGRSQRQRLDENMRSEEARYAAGSINRGALAAATLQARELDPQIDTAHRAYGAALLQFAQAIGADLGPGAALPAPEGALDFERANFSLEKESSAALARRPDLRFARLLVRAAAADERIAAAGYYPRLDLSIFGRYIPETNLREASSGSAQRSDDIISSEISPGVGYTWRVLDNGRVGGATLRRRALRESNALQLQKLEASVRRELVALQNNFRAIAARHDSLTQAVAVAEENLAVVEKSWREGLASQLEFRTAETGLLATRRGILESAYAQKMALAAWDRATGRYFQFPDETALPVHNSKP